MYSDQSDIKGSPFFANRKRTSWFDEGYQGQFSSIAVFIKAPRTR